MTPEERLQKLQKLKELRDLKAQQVAPVVSQEAVGTSLPEQAVNLGLIYAQGRSMGLGVKPMSAIGATMAYPFVAAGKAMQGEEIPSWVDLYKIPVQDIRQRVEQSREDSPWLSGAAEIAGGLKSGGEIAKSKAGQAFTSGVKNLIATKGTGAAAKLGMLGKGALVGGLVGEASQRAYEAGTSPVGDEAGILFSPSPSVGGMLGAASPVLSAGMAGALKALKPNIDDATRTLAQSAKSKYGIDLNLNQISGSNVSQNIQRASQAIPFSGTEKNRLKQLSQWNRAVSGTFGQQIDKFTMDSIDDAFKKAGKPFNDILSGKTINVKQADLDEISNLVTDATKNIEPSKVAILQANIDELLSGIENGQITGEKINSIRSALTERAKGADPFARPFISKLVDKVIDISTDGDPAIRKSLNEARRNYKNLNVALNAWDSKTNSINPARLETAVKATSGYGKRSYARGRAGELGELAQIGKTFLPEVGGSPTLPAALTNASALGIASGVVEPTAAALTAGGMLLNRALQEGVNRNPAVVRSILRTGTNLPAIPSNSSILRLPVSTGIGGGMLSGYLE